MGSTDVSETRHADQALWGHPRKRRHGKYSRVGPHHAKMNPMMLPRTAPTLLLLAACGDAPVPSCADGYVENGAGGCSLVESSEDGQGLDTGGPSDDAPFTLGTVRACETPADTVSYAEVGIEWGLAEPKTWNGEHAENGSVAVADFDLDGDLDVVLGFDGQAPILYSREAGGFVGTDLPVDDGLSQIGMADLDI